jgi:hypothetical protein
MLKEEFYEARFQVTVLVEEKYQLEMWNFMW